MKILGIGLIVVAGAAAAAPYVTGMMAENENKKAIEKINQNPEMYGTMNLATYDRGYLGSKVDYEYKLPSSLQAALGMDEPVIVACDYSHGFVGVTYDCNFAKNEFYTAALTELGTDGDPLSITGSVSAFGGASNTIALAEIKGASEHGQTFTLEPSKLVVNSDTAMTNYEFEGSIGDFTMADTLMAVTGTALNGDLQLIGDGLYTGKTSLTVDTFAMQGPGSAVAMADLAFHSDVVESGDNMDMTAEYKIGSVNPEAVGMDVKDLVLGLEVKGIDKNALIAYQKWSQELQASMALAGTDADALAAPDMSALMPILDQMLKKDAKLSINAKGKLNDTDNTISTSLSLLEKVTAEELQMAMFDPDAAFKKMALELDLNLDKSFIDSNPMGAMLARNPLVVAGATAYTSKINLGPQSTLNGNQVTVAEIMQMMMPQPQVPPADMQGLEGLEGLEELEGLESEGGL